MEHRKYMSSLLGNVMVQGGPFEDDLGGLAILRVHSLAEARSVAERDPGVQRGLMKVEVHKWRAQSQNSKPHSSPT